MLVFRQICNLPDFCNIVMADFSFQFVRHTTADYKSAVT